MHTRHEQIAPGTEGQVHRPNPTFNPNIALLYLRIKRDKVTILELIFCIVHSFHFNFIRVISHQEHLRPSPSNSVLNTDKHPFFLI